MDTEERARFGARVRQARKDAGRSQAEVAAAAGIAPNTLSAIERGGKAWAANAEAVARELGIESDGGFPPDVDVVRDLIGEWLTPMTLDERAKARSGMRWGRSGAGAPSLASDRDRRAARGR